MLAGGIVGSAELGDDGIKNQPRFPDSFLEMYDDLTTAAGAGRHLPVHFEQKGHSYCRGLHEINFDKPEIAECIEESFDLAQCDLWEATEVLDFDVKALEASGLACKWGAGFVAATIIFAVANAITECVEGAETVRLPELLSPFKYMSSRRYVV